MMRLHDESAVDIMAGLLLLGCINAVMQQQQQQQQQPPRVCCAGTCRS
jgi:hypothetical protein